MKIGIFGAVRGARPPLTCTLRRAGVQGTEQQCAGAGQGSQVAFAEKAADLAENVGELILAAEAAESLHAPPQRVPRVLSVRVTRLNVPVDLGCSRRDAGQQGEHRLVWRRGGVRTSTPSSAAASPKESTAAWVTAWDTAVIRSCSLAVTSTTRAPASRSRFRSAPTGGPSVSVTAAMTRPDGPRDGPNIGLRLTAATPGSQRAPSAAMRDLTDRVSA